MIAAILQVLMFVLPWSLRRRALNLLFGYRIDRTARIGLSIVLAEHLEMAAGSRIKHGVVCKNIDRLSLGPDSGITSVTFITGFSTRNARVFGSSPGRRCELRLGRGAGITSRQFIDCNGGVYIGDYATIAGLRTQILTHSVNVHTNRQEARPVHIGRYCFVGTSCIILPGSVLPDYCVLGAGAVLNKAFTETHALYAANPSVFRKKLDPETTLYFHRTTSDVY